MLSLKHQLHEYEEISVRDAKGKRHQNIRFEKERSTEGNKRRKTK
jgi:hypothetical protein